MENLQTQINELKTRLDLLTNSATIPFDIGEAMKERVGALSPSAVAPKTVAIGIGGGTAAKPSDGNFKTIDGKLIPYYNS